MIFITTGASQSWGTPWLGGRINLKDGECKEECKPWKVNEVRAYTKKGERFSGHKRRVPLGKEIILA
jgi:hypothetical protein